jgi:hypothetical protein
MLLTAALLCPVAAARADEPTGDEPMPKSPAGAPAATTPATTTPAASTPATTTPAATSTPAATTAAPAPAQTAPASVPAAAMPKVGADGLVEEIIPNPPKVYGWAFGGAAVGALLIGSILGGVAHAYANEQEGSVSHPPLYTNNLRDRGKTGAATAATGYAFLAIGGALAVTDVVLWYEIFRKPRTVKRTPEGVVVPPPGANQ